jgi:hypothetical protein
VTPRRTATLALVAYFLLAGAWALALPVNGTYDEKQHLVRAYAVWTGQFTPVGRALDATGLPTEAFDAPRSLLPENADCTWHPKPPLPASCQRPVTDRTHTLMPSSAARYSPVYYLAVGLPLRLSPDQTGLIWARLLSAALSALLLAAAVWVAARLGNRLLLAALVLVGTPLAMNLNGAINPNGLEISAGVLLFVALLAALRTPSRALLMLAGAAAALLFVVRELGPVLFVLAVLACLIMAGRERAAALLRERETWQWFGVPVAAGALFFAVWLLVSGSSGLGTPDELRNSMGLGAILKGIVTSRTEFYVRQIVAQFGYGETTVSLGMVALWYLLVAALVVPALWLGGRRFRIAVAGIVGACVALLVAGEIHFEPLVGWYSHSRYIMPLGVGVVLAAAFVDRYTAWLNDRGWLDRLALVLVAVTVPLDLYALARVMTRFQLGINAGLHPFGGSWQPAVGPVSPLLVCLVGGVLLTVMVARSSVPRVPQHSTVHMMSN